MTTPTTWPTCRGPTRASSRDRMSPPAKLGEGGSASSPRLENRPPPRLRRYSPTSGGEIHTAPTSGEPTPSPATPVLPHKRGRNPYGPHVWRTDPSPATPVLPHKRGGNPYGPHVWRTDPRPRDAATPPPAG